MNKFFSLKGKKTEIFISVLYIISLFFISYFHEPWFDEAQAWLISKAGSLWDIIYSFSKAEGHLPLWYLILSPFSKLGFPYEFTIKFINITICSLAIIIFELKSPFPKLIKWLIPFTYFLFYQYGIINRCYSLMILGFVLTAVTYKERNNHPFKFALSLIFLSLSSAYSIIIAFGITLNWLFEILKSSKYKIFKDKRMVSVYFIFFVFFILGIILLPANDVGHFFLTDKKFLINLSLMLFVIPISSLFYDCFQYGHLSVDMANGPELITCLFAGVIFFITLLFILKCYKKVFLFLVPYLLFSAFSAKVYFYMHHQGIVVIFLIFIAWVILDEKNKTKIPVWFSKLLQNNFWNKILNAAGLLIIFSSLSISIYWTITASVNDIKYIFNWTRETAQFIKDYNLEDKYIVSSYAPPVKENGKIILNTNKINSTEIYPYFKKNIIRNFHIREYLTHIRGNAEEEYQRLRQEQMPDIILNGGLDVVAIYGTKANNAYILAKSYRVTRIWKDKTYELTFPVFLERKLFIEKILKERAKLKIPTYTWEKIFKGKIQKK